MQMKPPAAAGQAAPQRSRDEDPLPSQASVNTSTPVSQEQPRILVVEDQDDVRRMLATALEIEGYAVEEATNAREGLDRLSRCRFDLVLTDYAMPGGTGKWMLQEARRLGLMAGTAALIVTAHPDVREPAGVSVINKPFDLELFLEKIHSLLQH
jgi:two-component system response regulator GlrR